MSDLHTYLYALIVGAVYVLFILHILEHYHQFYTTKWFRPYQNRWAGKYEWKDIKEILETDPLCKKAPPKLSEIEWFGEENIFRFIKDLALFAVAIGILSVMGAIGLYCVNNGESALEKFSSLGNKDGIVAAIVAGLGTLYIAANELRARVRSQNRQKWVDDVRATLAIVLNHVQKHPKAALREPCPANRARMRLELLLNPSEKDHRTLGVLLRMAYGCDTIDADKIVLEKLAEIKTEVEYLRTNHEQLITWIIRLSNAMLKREWELVKYGK